MLVVCFICCNCLHVCVCELVSNENIHRKILKVAELIYLRMHVCVCVCVCACVCVRVCVRVFWSWADLTKSADL